MKIITLPGNKHDLAVPISKSEPLYDWKLTNTISAGLLVPIDTIIFNVKSYCRHHDINVEIEQCGWFIKHVVFYFSGTHPRSEIDIYVNTLKEYFYRLQF